ncbi:AAA family ATPase [Enterococcus hirae]|uniref:AAA family ATPase n=1 Tax=unclassified Enterococcus TaxID=2608891 RepID=UPI002E9CEFB8|nr:AAA family ATPase [Enterococcus hirae]
MNIYLNKLEVLNFKSFSSNQIKTFYFEGNKATIFDGPNGYGKSTVFDSIELLITGDISHFESTLKNGFPTYLSVIANSDTQPTEIVGHFGNNVTNFKIKRIFKWENKNESEVFYSDKDKGSRKITNDEVYKLLNINENFFKIGMYIQQNDSLLFLQEKYKDRKKILTSILDMQEIEDRKDFLKLIKTKFNEKTKKIGSILENKKRELIDKQKEFVEILEKSQVKDQHIKYRRLLMHKEYPFDSENIDITIPLEIYISQINSIKKLVENYSIYRETKKNIQIKKLLQLPDVRLKRYFYQSKIMRYMEEKEWWDQLSFLEKCLEQHKYPLEICEYDLLKENKDIVDKIHRYHSDIIKKEQLEKLLKNDKTELIKFNQKRKELHEQHNKSEVFDNEHCPYCGSLVEDLEKSYDDFSQYLVSSMDDKQVEMDQYNLSLTKLDTFIFEKIKDLISPFLEEQTFFYELRNVKNITQEELYTIEKIIPDFSSIFKEKENEKQNVELLITQFRNHLESLTKGKEVYSSEEMLELDRISKEYFDSKRPEITKKDLDLKLFYIQLQYQDVYVGKIKKVKNEIEKIEKLIQKHEDARMILDLIDLIKNYNDQAYKEFQENFVQNIQLPLFLISGRILQNYQLGLGIYVDVNSTQVVFKVAYKERTMDTDIFNILSVGQLNGVILSLLFAIRKIYSKENQFDIIMIDDPLQSIDEISSHSFADFLVEEFPETQLILSTHEEEKSRLIQYKYQQVSKKANNYNMQLEYLKS